MEWGGGSGEGRVSVQCTETREYSKGSDSHLFRPSHCFADKSAAGRLAKEIWKLTVALLLLTNLCKWLLSKSPLHYYCLPLKFVSIVSVKWPYLDLLSIRWLFKTNFLPHGKSEVAGGLELLSTSRKERDNGLHAICNLMMAESLNHRLIAYSTL